jgi:hypothetical protein
VLDLTGLTLLLDIQDDQDDPRPQARPLLTDLATRNRS